MNILVTGGAGFMGSSFVRYLIKKKLVDKVINLDLLTYAGNLDNLRDVKDSSRYKFIKGDIKDKRLLADIITEFDVKRIVNFAAETHVDNSIKSPQIFLETNILGTAALLDIATEFDIRFHQVSTDEVFGALDEDDPPFHEKSLYDPRSPYSASKAAGDHLAKSYFNTYGTKITISNSSNNYGPYQFPEKIIPLFITNLMQDKKVPVYGDGLYIRDWLFVEDHTRAIWRILVKGEIGQSYCIGAGNEMTNLELTKKILDLLDKDESYIEYVQDRKGHDRRYATDTTKIQKEIKWKSEIKFDEGIRKTVEWYKANKWWWRKLK
ncbi:dTDP-glucose 4,6-dehydratase [Candidatus Dojkabacteria bacterium]|nr:dTDP-glucose 4,6-dehydratase [Candidatus Dojkabacteria bacterium]